jgi:hypothetical protein
MNLADLKQYWDMCEELVADILILLGDFTSQPKRGTNEVISLGPGYLDDRVKELYPTLLISSSEELPCGKEKRVQTTWWLRHPAYYRA